MNISDWVVVVAIILAPIIAIQIQKFIERRQMKIERQVKVFKLLMATRATPISVAHVEALNMIDIEFYDNKKVTEAWKLLLDHFGNYPTDANDPKFQDKLETCIEKSKELLTDLQYEMGTSLNYHFDKVHLKRGAYLPKGHADTWSDQEFIRRSLIGLFLGKVPIPIKLVDKEK